MSLLEQALATPPSRGPQCTVGIAKIAHPELAAEIDELIEAVAKGLVFGTTAARIANDAGLAMKDEAILRHAKRGQSGGCSCP